MGTYQPAEDSYLLAAAVAKYAFGTVLDMGTGSGIQVITAARKKDVKSAVAADVNDEALKFAAAAAKKAGVKITFAKSDLFSQLHGKTFDTIIFNPPYLPQDHGIRDDAIYGGKHGYEVIERFLGECSSHLKEDGIILLLFSSHTNKQKVDEIIAGNCLEKEEILQQHVSFEDLYVYLIRKSPLLQQLEKKGIRNLKLFEKGTRGVLYKGNYKAKSVVVKAKREESAAVATIENETAWLKKLNKKGIGPKLLFTGNGWFSYEFVEGEFIADFVVACKGRKKIIAVLKQLLLQCRKMDLMKVNKEEMLRPYKHVLVKNGRAVMIDFEKCKIVSTPKNVTQLCQFLIAGRMNALLKQKGIAIDREKLLEAAKHYKNNYGIGSFNKILKLI